LGIGLFQSYWLPLLRLLPAITRLNWILLLRPLSVRKTGGFGMDLLRTATIRLLYRSITPM